MLIPIDILLFVSQVALVLLKLTLVALGVAIWLTTVKVILWTSLN